MSTPDLNLFSEQVFRDAAFGLGLLAIVLVLNTILFIRIFLWFLKGSAKLVKPRALDLIILFVSSVLLMSLVQIGSIMIWTVALYATGLIADIRLAMLFSGSSYTTLGIFSDVLPQGWKSVAFYIAFSGLFSFAIATSSMMSMLTIVTKRLYKSTPRP
ncbi:hypothetical protein [Zwartia panacis]|jgi:hypothetical protein|uniref:hypothetical protein n=1 Tax=Zwartia panacis TaxID=2683345 RepID=UPI0025B3981F|nr:hypothetical protein [Zwartia panacis]MDN4017169.1 hypothetical protein [Zwartia panacis]